jgi:hypothetical protein
MRGAFCPSFWRNMGRQKKNKSLQIEEKKIEVIMTQENDQKKNESEAWEITLEGIQKEIDTERLELEIDRARLELEKIKIEIEEKKQEMKAFVPRREISEDEQRIIDKQITNINKKKSGSEVIEKQKAYDNQMITGRFMNRRSPGQQVKLTYNKYADDPVKWYHFKDGGTYTIPRGFVDQINEYYHTPRFVEKQGPQVISDRTGENSAIAEVDTSNKKYAFVAIGFAG